ncbi:MAG: class I SAM-dependent methyltransferase [Actinomycetota bacterium]
MSGLFHRRPRERNGAGSTVPGASPSNAAAGPLSNDWRTYDSIAGTYERIHARRLEIVAADLVSVAGVAAGQRVLDVGTGTGVVAEAARRAGAVAVGIDASPAMLAVAREARPEVPVAAAAAIDLPFRDATFDVVTAGFVLSHFHKLDTAMFDLIRVLKPGGRLAVTSWAETEDEFQRTWRELIEQLATHEMLDDAMRRAMPNEERFRDKRRLEQALRDARLRPVDVEQRQYRFVMALDDYIDGRTTTTSGRFLRDMLGDDAWSSFLERARATFRERFPDPLTDFRDVNLAVATKPADYVAANAQGRA